jgi:hypothetical protein
MIILGLGIEKEIFDYSMIIGYTIIFLAMAAIYFGIRHYRDHLNEGRVSFVQGLLIGLGIALISTIFYSLAWLITYYNFMPDFMDQYIAYSIEKMNASGASADEISKFSADVEKYKEMYKSPLMIFFITMIEPLPVALPVAFLSAFILKKQ